MARYLTDGRLDRSFGDDGRVTIDVSPSAEQFTDVVILPDGRIVAAGWAEVSLVPVFSAVRYRRAAGSIPRSTGTASRAWTWRRAPIARTPWRSRARRPRPRRRRRRGWSRRVGLIRLGPRGHLDPTFGRHGWLVTDFGPAFERRKPSPCRRTASCSSRGGSARATRTTSGPAAQAGWRSRLHVQPADGLSRTSRAATSAARDVLVAPNGKLVVAGEATSIGSAASWSSATSAILDSRRPTD